MIQTKTCTGCGRDLQLEKFPRNKNGRLGRASRCKVCFQHYNASRTTRIFGASGSHTVDQWLKIKEHYAPGNQCPVCGKVGKITLDHVVSLSQGGTNNADNLQPLCLSCNSKKSYHSTEDHRPDKGAFAAAVRAGLALLEEQLTPQERHAALMDAARKENEMNDTVGRIEVEFSEGSLFGGMAQQDIDEWDVKASVAQFAESLMNHLYDEYPDAEIVVNASINDRILVNDWRDHEEIPWIQNIVEKVFSGDSWMVPA